MANNRKTRDSKRVSATFPVLRWLQIGAVTAGVGVALAATPGIAAADDGASSSGSNSPDSSSSAAVDSPATSTSGSAPTRTRERSEASRRVAPVTGVAGGQRTGAARASAPTISDSVAVPRTAAALAPRRAQRDGASAAISPRAAKASAPVAADASDVSVPRASQLEPTTTVESAIATAITEPPNTGTETAAYSQPLTSLTPAPKAVKAPAVPALLRNIDANNQAAVTRIFRGLLEVLSTLPVNPVTTGLESVLWAIRRDLVNQAPGVRYQQTVNSSSLVKGRIDAIDPEGDAYTVSVVTPAQQGTFVLEKTYEDNGIGTTKYTYAPGAGYTGSDSVVVKVSPVEKTFNILRPFGNLTEQYVTIQLGSGANSGPLDGAGIFDVTAFAAGVEATVVRQPSFFSPNAVTVTLSNAAAKTFALMDSRGAQGAVAGADLFGDKYKMLQNKAASNASQPLLALVSPNLSDPQATFVDVKRVTKNADGTVTVTGTLMDNAPDTVGVGDKWDMIGNEYKTLYEAYLANTASSTEYTKSLAILTTMTATVNREAGGGDYSTTPSTAGPSANFQIRPGSISTGVINANNGTNQTIPQSQTNGSTYDATSGSTFNGTSQLTALLQYGNQGSFLSGYNMSGGTSASGVNLYTAASPGNPTPTWLAPANEDTTTGEATFANPIFTPNTQQNGTACSGSSACGNSPVLSMATFNPVLWDTTTNNFAPAVFTGSGGAVVPIQISVETNTFISTGSINSGPGANPIKGDLMSLFPPPTSGALLSPIALLPSPSSLVGATVTATGDAIGANVPAGTVVSSYTGTASSTDVASYVLSSSALVNETSGTTTDWGNLSFTLTQPWTYTGSGGISDGALGVGTTLQLVVPQDWVVSPGECPQCDALVNGTISGTGVAGVDNSLITGFTGVGTGPAGANGNVATYTTNIQTPQLIGAVPGKILTLDLPGGIDPHGLVGQRIQLPETTVSGDFNGYSPSIPPGTLITGLVSGSVGGTAIYSLGNDASGEIVSATVWIPEGSQIETPNLPARQNGAVIGLANGDVYYWNGTDTGCEDNDDTCSSGWTQLASGATFGNSGINAIVTTPALTGGTTGNTHPAWAAGGSSVPTIAVGTAAGDVYRFDATLTADGQIVGAPGMTGCSASTTTNCWTSAGATPDKNAVSAMIASPGGVTVGTSGGNLYTYNGTGSSIGVNTAGNTSFSIAAGWTTVSSTYSGQTITSLVAYDGTTLVGAISGAPVEVNTAGNAPVAPGYLNTLETEAPDLVPLVNGCDASYDGGAGTGCSGFLLTVQQAAGTPLTAGQTLYGGNNLLPGTTIVKQLSNASGNSCSSGCVGAGGAGLYLVDQYQYIAPGSPMSASQGAGFVAGTSNGEVYVGGIASTELGGQIANGGWTNFSCSGKNCDPSGGAIGGGVMAIVPWRDGFVAGLGYAQYCSAGECFGGAIAQENWAYGGVASWIPGASGQALPGGINLTYSGQFAKGWTMLQGPSTVSATGDGNFDSQKGPNSAPGWQLKTSALTPFGDGFAIGLTAPAKGTGSANSQNDYTNGLVGIYTGFAASTGGPGVFGAGETASNSFNQIANPNGSPGDFLASSQNAGTVQQLFSFTQNITDTVTGALEPNQTLVAALTNGAIWAWNPNGPSSTDSWTVIQAPASQAPPATLAGSAKNPPNTVPYNIKDAYDWASSIADSGKGFSWKPGGAYTTGSTSGGGIVGNSGWTAPAGLPSDPLFGGNGTVADGYLQADPSSTKTTGDYRPFLVKYDLPIPSVGTATLADPGVQLTFDSNVLTYGYMFMPSGIINKFLPGKYSVAALVALEAQPTVNLVTGPAWECTGNTCDLKKKKEWSKTYETDFGTFGLGAGVDYGLTITSTGGCSETGCNFSEANTVPNPLAQYSTIQGMLFTWNVPGSDGMSTSYNGVQSLAVAPGDSVTVTPYLDPFISASYGLFTSPSTPLIGEWDIIKIGAQYSNPIEMPITINGSGLQMEVKAQGVVDAFAEFIPQVTSALSWKQSFQAYNIDKTVFSIG
jgi:hypothetical protein